MTPEKIASVRVRIVGTHAAIAVRNGFIDCIYEASSGQTFYVLVELGQPERIVSELDALKFYGAGDELVTRRRNRRVTPDLLQRVAEVYRQNIDSAPTQAVRKAFYVSERQAGNYVRRAREAGFLPATTPGKKKG